MIDFSKYVQKPQTKSYAICFQCVNFFEKSSMKSLLDQYIVRNVRCIVQIMTKTCKFLYNLIKLNTFKL